MKHYIKLFIFACIIIFKGFISTIEGYYDAEFTEAHFERAYTDINSNTHTVRFNTEGQIEQFVEKDEKLEMVRKRNMYYDGQGNKVRDVQAIIGRNDGNTTYSIGWEYDEKKRLTSVTEALDHSKPRKTSYGYTPENALSTISKPDGTDLNFRYTRNGKLTHLSSADGSIDYTYEYDDAGNLLKGIDNVREVSTIRAYNDERQMIAETFDHGYGLSFILSADGEKVCRLPDGSTIGYSYQEHRLSKICRQDADGNIAYELESFIRGDKPQSSANDNAQNIDVEIQDSAETKTILQTTKMPWGDQDQIFYYDTCSQITQEAGLNSHQYKYDSLQNCIAKDGHTWEIDALNQLTLTNEYALKWDSNGNCVEKTSIASGKTTVYTYDALNRLISVKKTGDHLYKYTYDPFHRRTAKVISAWNHETKQWKLEDETFYIYDKEKEIGSIDRHGKILELRILKDAFSDIGATIAIELHGQAYRPLHDASGSICALISLETNEICEYYLYSAFGEISVYDAAGTPLARSTERNPWLYFSKRLDHESALYFFGMRYYSPELCRWISADPMGFADGANRFVFMRNDPLNNKDFYGLFSVSDPSTGEQGFLSILYDTVSSYVHQFRSCFSLETHAADNFVEWSSEGFGAFFLHLIGFHDETPETGTIGSGEFDEKIRITFVNGILNIHADAIKSAQIISETHGGINVHYIYRPTLGWSWDMVKSIFVKSGYVFADTEMLANTWKNLIAEMGGTDGGGSIIHYAHSIGSADTYSAQLLLTPEEQKMIKVITFGSPSLHLNEGFLSVCHYISVRDVIPLMDISNRIGALFRGDEHIIPVGSYLGIPFVDHFLDSQTYRSVIESLGKEFMSLYQS